jgi:hypothetical protein
MSKYSQLPRDTLALLAHRAKQSLFVRDYVDWAGNALVDGFDSPSLKVLAGLDYAGTSSMEVSRYFLKAVKELNLPISDCELAYGNWYWTDVLYRQEGLALPDKVTLLFQHLDELAFQIREGALDPVIGLDRIYDEFLFPRKYGLGEFAEIRETDPQERIEVDTWKWDELWDYVHYDSLGHKDPEPERKNEEIIAFAANWLERLDDEE